jgi:succinate dehydrogenase/fumarate reductase cytochrome b subunit
VNNYYYLLIKKLLAKGLIIAAFLGTELAYGATVTDLANKFIKQLINPLIAVMVGIAVVVFLWGVVEFIAKAGNEEARTTGKQHIVWGLIGLTIMIGFWGIVAMLQNFFGLK